MTEKPLSVCMIAAGAIKSLLFPIATGKNTYVASKKAPKG